MLQQSRCKMCDDYFYKILQIISLFVLLLLLHRSMIQPGYKVQGEQLALSPVAAGVDWTGALSQSDISRLGSLE